MLEGGFEELVFCNECWAQFITASGLAMGLIYPGEPAEIEPDEAPGPEPVDIANDHDGPDHPDRVQATVPEGAATEDQRPDQDDPAPY